MPLKPVKSTFTKWSMWIPVSVSTVFQVQAMPPELNDSLIMPRWACWPGSPCCARQAGSWTIESRGKLITIALSRFGDMCASMIVSVRSPGMLWPYLAFLPSRWSEPTTSTFMAVLATLAGRAVPRSPRDVLVLDVSGQLQEQADPGADDQQHDRHHAHDQPAEPAARALRRRARRRLGRIDEPAAHVTPKG